MQLVIPMINHNDNIYNNKIIVNYHILRALMTLTMTMTMSKSMTINVITNAIMIMQWLYPL